MIFLLIAESIQSAAVLFSACIVNAVIKSIVTMQTVSKYLLSLNVFFVASIRKTICYDDAIFSTVLIVDAFNCIRLSSDYNC